MSRAYDALKMKIKLMMLDKNSKLMMLSCSQNYDIWLLSQLINVCNNKLAVQTLQC